MLALGGALLVLLAVLAALQYQWIGRVSDTERHRLKSSLRTRADQFAQDFDRELTRIFATFQIAADAVRTDPGAAYASRLERWQATSPYPRIVDRIYTLQIASGRLLRLMRFNPESRTFEPAEWPKALERWREPVERTLEVEGNLPPPAWPELLEIDAPALVIPIPEVRTLQGAQRLEEFEVLTSFHVTIVTLDLAYVRQEVLPALARRYFSGPDGVDYNVAIVSRNETSDVIYASDPDWRGENPGLADATAAMFQIRFDEVPGLIDPGVTAGDGREGQRRSDRISVAIVRRAHGSAAPGIRFHRDEVARWQLALRHRAGSLEAVVAQSRVRNLLVGVRRAASARGEPHPGRGVHPAGRAPRGEPARVRRRRVARAPHPAGCNLLGWREPR